MFRSTAVLLGFVLNAAPAAAANYSATLTKPATGRFITRDISWNCGPAACQGATDESRPAVLCQSLAKRAGRVETFLVDGRAFDSTELNRCNASAKSAPAESLASQ
ncbi:MAG TPA: hypothetical protein VG434_01185 [Sphingomicrobium sp.]|nr:hypothetical protein [Sphingomicrobium sp.]